MKLTADINICKNARRITNPKGSPQILKCSQAYVYKLVERGHLPAWIYHERMLP